MPVNPQPMNQFNKTALLEALKSRGQRTREFVRFVLKLLEEENYNDSQILAEKLLSIRCPLYITVLLRQAQLTRLMLESGSTVGDRDPDILVTALHEACRLSDFDSAKLLIEYGADVNAKTINDEIPLAFHNPFDSSDKAIETLELLTNQCTTLMDIKATGDLQPERLLRIGNRRILEVLLKLDINWCTLNSSGRSLLYSLMLNRNLFSNQDILEKLRNKKVAVNIVVPPQEFSELTIAAMECLTEMVELLLINGADPNVKDEQSRTPLLITSGHEENPKKKLEKEKIFTLLLYYGADPQHGIFNQNSNQTVFGNIVRFKNFHLLVPAISQLAIKEYFENAVIQPILDIINSNEVLKKQFLSSTSQLKELKQIKTSNKVSLFSLLTESQKTLTNYARKDEFLNEWKILNAICINAYYRYVLEKNFKTTVQIRNRRKNMNKLICDIMEISYDSYPIIVDKITDYALS